MKFKHIALAVAFGVGSYGIAKFCLNQTGRLIMTDMLSSRSFNPAFETRPLTAEEDQEVQSALGQTYTYYGCGGQAFVFFSEDGKYVIKFFKQRHFRLPTYLNYIPFAAKYRDRKFAKRKKRIERDYFSYKIGFEEMEGLAGLIYLHLNPTKNLKTRLRVIDKLQIAHTIDLDGVDFILQRRASQVFPTLHQLMQQGKVVEAQNTVADIVHLVVQRCKRGLRDADPSIATNCGILEGRAMKIDVGRFTRDAMMSRTFYYKPELYAITRPFRGWLAHHYPQLVPSLDQEILKVVRE